MEATTLGRSALRVPRMGLGVMVLILRDAYRTNDRPFKWIGWCMNWIGGDLQRRYEGRWGWRRREVRKCRDPEGWWRWGVMREWHRCI